MNEIERRSGMQARESVTTQALVLDIGAALSQCQEAATLLFERLDPVLAPAPDQDPGPTVPSPAPTSRLNTELAEISERVRRVTAVLDELSRRVAL